MFDPRKDAEPSGGPLTLADINAGIVAGTRVATPIGWRPVETLAVGDQVLTFDGGMQTVTALRRDTVVTGRTPGPRAHWPLHIPAGALGNRGDMLLMPAQPVTVESDTAEQLFGDPFATIPAAALEGYRGITRAAPPARIEVITLVFAQDEIVFGNSGALFLCPHRTDLLDNAPATYPVLPLEEADLLVSCLEFEDHRMPDHAPLRAVA